MIQESGAQAAISAEGLTFAYDGGRALDAVSFSAPAGEITALVGPNGAGKTTLMRLLAGLAPLQAGRASVLGVDVEAEPRKIHRLVGYLADFIGLWEPMTVAQHLDHAARCAGLDSETRRARTAVLAEKLDLSAKLDARAGDLSRGQRQRVAIAQALAKEPRVLILDEPASGLDPEARKSLSALMLELKAAGVTLLVSSHILSELEDYSDHILVMRGGRVERAEALRDLAAQQVVEVTLSEGRADLAADLAAALAAALAAPGHSIKALAPDRAEITATGGPAEHAQILGALVGAGLPVAAFAPRRRRLEDAYFSPQPEPVAAAAAAGALPGALS